MSVIGYFLAWEQHKGDKTGSSQGEYPKYSEHDQLHWSFNKMLETKGFLMGGIACKSLPIPLYWQTLANLTALIF